jgi:DNA processing protein
VVWDWLVREIGMSIDPFDIIRVSLLPKVGSTRGRLLLRRFGTFEGIVGTSFRELTSIERIDAATARGIIAFNKSRESLDGVERTIESNRRLMEQHKFALVTFLDAAYPAALKRIYDPPLFLFRHGDYNPEDGKAVAIVGTRTPSDYGREAAAMLVAELAEQGITIVSGLALGIDAAAHAAALQSATRTVAVLGSGLANIYPAANARLAGRIAEKGCLFSEFTLGAKPDAQNFPRRNRIISGLSSAVVVVESRVTGGAIITAELAFDQNKEVFAVPGSIFSPKSAGCHLLFKKGVARPITSAQDIFDELPALASARAKKAKPPIQLNLIEQAVVDALSDQPVHIDELASRTGLPTSELLVTLLKLEFVSVVRQLPGKHFIPAA